MIWVPSLGQEDSLSSVDRGAWLATVPAVPKNWSLNTQAPNIFTGSGGLGHGHILRGALFCLPSNNWKVKVYNASQNQMSKNTCN